VTGLLVWRRLRLLCIVVDFVARAAISLRMIIAKQGPSAEKSHHPQISQKRGRLGKALREQVDGFVV